MCREDGCSSSRRRIFRAGGAGSSSALYQYTLTAPTTPPCCTNGRTSWWRPCRRRGRAEGRHQDQQDNGLETDLVIDRDAASRLSIDGGEIDNTLYDAFGQRQVSTNYRRINQYHVVMGRAALLAGSRPLVGDLREQVRRQHQRHAVDERRGRGQRRAPALRGRPAPLWYASRRRAQRQLNVIAARGRAACPRARP